MFEIATDQNNNTKTKKKIYYLLQNMICLNKDHCLIEVKCLALVWVIPRDMLAVKRSELNGLFMA